MIKLDAKLFGIFLFIGGVASAAPATLMSLKPGTYVVASYKPCEEAPLAGVVEFDGKAVFGPHESKCTARVVSRRGQTYRVSTECRAHGDGSPDTPHRWTRTVRVDSSSRLAVEVGGKSIEYELCPGFH